MLASPFSKSLDLFTGKTGKKLTLVLFIVFIIITLVMNFFNTPLVNDICENGIISFEFAKQLSISNAILNSWDESAEASAGLSLGLDFLYLIVYSSLIALIIYRLNQHLWKNNPFIILGNLLIWAIFLAAFFDVIENIALLKLLLGETNPLWATMAYYFALLKFTLILICVGYIFMNIIWLLIKKISNQI